MQVQFSADTRPQTFRNAPAQDMWIVLAALLLVSIAPLWLYHREVLRLSEDKLQDTERVQQEIARAIAGEILQFQSNLHESWPLSGNSWLWEVGLTT